MKVHELITQLKKMPSEADVLHLWDGELRTEINHVYLGKTGIVVTADNKQVSYSDEGRPVGSPSPLEVPFWTTPTI